MVKKCTCFEIPDVDLEAIVAGKLDMRVFDEDVEESPAEEISPVVAESSDEGS